MCFWGTHELGSSASETEQTNAQQGQHARGRFGNRRREAFPLGGTIQRPKLVTWLFARSQFFRLICIHGDLFQFAAEADPVQWNQAAIGDNNVVHGLQRFRWLADRYGFRPVVAIWPQFLDDRIVDVHFLPDSDQLIVEALARQNALASFRLSDYFRSDHADNQHEGPRLYYTQGDSLHPSSVGARVASEAIQAVLSAPASQLDVPRGVQADHATAIVAAAKLGQAKPNFARVYNRLGDALYKQGKFEGAIAKYEQALREDIGNAAAHNNLGVTLEALGRTDEAKQHFIQAVESQPDFALAHFNLSRILVRTGQPTAAMHGFRKTLELNPDHPGANYQLGAVLAKLQRLDEAQTYLQVALDLDPNHVQAHNDLGVIFAAQGHYQEAIEHFQTTIQLQPDHVRAAQNLSNTRKLLEGVQ